MMNINFSASNGRFMLSRASLSWNNAAEDGFNSSTPNPHLTTSSLSSSLIPLFLLFHSHYSMISSIQFRLSSDFIILPLCSIGFSSLPNCSSWCRSVRFSGPLQPLR